MTQEERKQLAQITIGLMLSGNLGDVHEEVYELHDLLGLPRPEGDYFDGFSNDVAALEMFAQGSSE